MPELLLYVRSETGETTPVEVDSEAQVKDVLEAVGVPGGTISFGGRALGGDEMLCDTGVSNECVVEVSVSLFCPPDAGWEAHPAIRADELQLEVVGDEECRRPRRYGCFAAWWRRGLHARASAEIEVRVQPTSKRGGRMDERYKFGFVDSDGFSVDRYTLNKEEAAPAAIWFDFAGNLRVRHELGAACSARRHASSCPSYDVTVRLRVDGRDRSVRVTTQHEGEVCTTEMTVEEEHWPADVTLYPFVSLNAVDDVAVIRAVCWRERPT
eukprot:TRINITY_DN3169_c0_g1_i9.p1 TRINITY_DN3169_c0_g1~~TRINITY_DN3169_c0_g1_i9.p1  ORF type:complete len:268 (+),score=55.74 TRINITY_DN3169_c0_g1_i9:52-855(+)